MASIKHKRARKLRSGPTGRSATQFGVVFELSRRQLMGPRLGVNHATAVVTGCVLAALGRLTTPSVRRFVAVAGSIANRDTRQIEALEDAMISQITQLLTTALNDSNSEATASLALDSHIIHLRLFGDSVTAKEWVEEHGAPKKPPARRVLQKESSDSYNKLNEAIDKLVVSLPTDFASRRTSLLRLHDHVRSVIGRSFESALNEKAASLPQDTYEDKKKLAKWVNAQLRELGLTIKCPKTGESCLLLANAGHDPSIGRFHLEYTDSEGGKHRTVTSTTLPHLEPMVNDLARANYAERSGHRR